MPQWRVLFRHLNFQEWSEHVVVCTFWLANVLPDTMACNFSSLIWPDGSAPVALASLLFDPPPPEPEIIGRTLCFATIPFRAPASSFFSLSLFSDLLPGPSNSLKISVVLHNHRRFIKFMVVSSVSPKSYRRGMSWLCFPSAWPCLLTSNLLSKYGAAHPS